MHISPYEPYQNKMGVRLSYIVSDPDKAQENSAALISYDALAKRAKRTPGLRLRQGRGAGNEALINWASIPHDWKEVLIQKFGHPEKDFNPLQRFFTVSGEAKRFFDRYQLPNGEYLSQKHRSLFTVNASMLNAVIALKAERMAQRKARAGNKSGIWESLINDSVNFQDHLKGMGLCQHTLPSSVKRFRMWYNDYQKYKYDSLIDGRILNQNALVVTPEMIELWKNIYAGQRNYKATYIEVAMKYKAFLEGELEILNDETGELYNPELECYNRASESTIYGYQSIWENKAPSHFKRSGDRQKFKAEFDPYHKLVQPNFAGSIISIDDRQPPFEYAPGKRMWFYMGIDLGSEAFTTWVWGDSKEGIIKDFYRQMVRNYFEWGINIPYELECEMSLNSSFKDNLLQNGSMFQEVRIEANNARGKRIEAYFRQLRYGLEKKEDGWIARPHALSESNQKASGKVPVLPKNEIVKKALKAISDWNNAPHSNQELHPGLCRWEVFMQKQHPEVPETNWMGILPHIGYEQSSSMKAGRIKLQGKARVVGYTGEVATGEKLINIMKQIEGQSVNVYWLDDVHGKVMKAMVFDREGTFICDLMADHEHNGDLAYNKSKLEQTEADLQNREIMSAYASTVQGFINQNARKIESVTIIEKAKPTKKAFVMPGLEEFDDDDQETEVMPTVEPDFEADLNEYENQFNTSTSSRF